MSSDSLEPAKANLPLVSVLTPSFQQGPFIGDCIASVRNQTYTELEQIVCDGGSTDETIDVLRAAPQNVRWVSEPDGGQSHALNKAFAMSRGEIIGWVNSDDAYFDREAVARAVNVFVRKPEVDVVYGHSALVNADGLILQMIWVPPFNYRLLRHANFVVQPSTFIRRSALDSQIVDEEYDHSMDRELWLRLGVAGHHFTRIDTIVAIDRHQPNRKVYTRSDLSRADERRLITAYAIPPNARYRAPRKLFKVACRLRGVGLVRQASRPTAFDGYVDHPLRLLARQAVLLRTFMPYAQPTTDTHWKAPP
jgi:glycosyltransferase involved in cell wall biosynthesis